jgi:mannose-6-phosphate isomerase-like protein (cupin superfamily)
MAGYAITNLKEVEDSAPKFGLSPALEARFPRGQLEVEGIGLSYQRLAPNARQPFGHRHREQEEVYVVVAGSGRANLDGEIVPLDTWDVLRVAPSVIRSFEAGPGGMDVICIGGRKPDGPDGERHPDPWVDGP